MREWIAKIDVPDDAIGEKLERRLLALDIPAYFIPGAKSVLICAKIGSYEVPTAKRIAKDEFGLE